MVQVLDRHDEGSGTSQGDAIGSTCKLDLKITVTREGARLAGNADGNRKRIGPGREIEDSALVREGIIYAVGSITADRIGDGCRTFSMIYLDRDIVYNTRLGLFYGRRGPVHRDEGHLIVRRLILAGKQTGAKCGKRKKFNYIFHILSSLINNLHSEPDSY